MSETMDTLRRKLNSAHELGAVVRTMKTLAAANIGQYERAVRSLSDYNRTVELALAAYFRGNKLTLPVGESRLEPDRIVGAVVFGSDQGLVGRFNDYLAGHVVSQLRSSAEKSVMWVVGERMASCLGDAGLQSTEVYSVPDSTSAITTLVTQLLADIEERRTRGDMGEIFVFHNRPGLGAGYEAAQQRLLPLDQQLVNQWVQIPWPTPRPPQVLARGEATLLSLIREYLFVAIFRACGGSLASENASRLAAMQRAERNIGDLVEELTRAFNQTRQTAIDEELFDLLGGFEALSQQPTKRTNSGG